MALSYYKIFVGSGLEQVSKVHRFLYKAGSRGWGGDLIKTTETTSEEKEFNPAFVLSLN